MQFQDLVEARRKGAHPSELVEAGLGPDRMDDIDSDEAKTREFSRIASMAAAGVPYVGPNWIDVIAQQVRQANGEGMRELVDMATRNRDQYAGLAKIDTDGSFALWDAILKGLLGVSTSQLPPPAPPLNAAPLP